MDLIKSLLFVGILLTLKTDSHPSLFNRRLVGVLFNPITFYTDMQVPYEIQELIPVISEVASRFTQLRCITEREFNGARMLWIATSVATYNLDYARPDELPLELSISATIPANHYGSHRPPGWNFVMDAVIEANEIFPNTTRKVLIEHSDFIVAKEGSQLKVLEAYLAEAESDNYAEAELGTSLPLEFCADNNLHLILKHVTHIVFNWWPFMHYARGESNLEDPQTSIHRLSERFAKCQATLKKYGDKISIEIQTGWIFRPENPTEHDENLVAYWKLMNDFALKFKTTVTMWAAFSAGNLDNEDTNQRERGGWWTVFRNTNIDEYVCIEQFNGSLSSSF